MEHTTTTRYRAEVYLGGPLLGLGRWATGRRWVDRARADREGERLADAASRVAGGSPTIEIVEIGEKGGAA